MDASRMSPLDSVSTVDEPSVVEMVLAYQSRFFQLIVAALLGWSAFVGWLTLIAWREHGQYGWIPAVFLAFRRACQSAEHIRVICYIACLQNIVLLLLARKKNLRLSTRVLIMTSSSAVAVAMGGVGLGAPRYIYWAAASITVTLLVASLVAISRCERSGIESGLKVFFQEMSCFVTQTGRPALMLFGLIAIWRCLVAATSSLDGDEVFSFANYSQLGPIISLTRYDFPNNHVLLNMLNSVIFWPEAPVGLTRIISIASGMLFIISICQVSRLLFDRRAALGILVVSLMSLLLLRLQTQNRGYSPALAAIGLAMLWFVRSNSREYSQRKRRQFYSLALCVGSVAVMFIPAFILAWMLLAIAGHIGLANQSKNQWQAAMVVLFSLALFWLPSGIFVGVLWKSTHLFTAWSASGQILHDSLIEAFRFVFVPNNAKVNLPIASSLYVVGIAGLVVLAIGLFSCYQNQAWRRWLFSCLGAGTLALAVGTYLIEVTPGKRQMFQFLPMAMVVMGAGIGKLATLAEQRFGKNGVAAVILLAGLACSLPIAAKASVCPREDSKEFADMMRTLNARLGPDDLIILHCPYTEQAFSQMDPNQRFHAHDQGFAKFARAPLGGEIWLLCDQDMPLPEAMNRISLALAKAYEPASTLYHGQELTMHVLKKRR